MGFFTVTQGFLGLKGDHPEPYLVKILVPEQGQRGFSGNHGLRGSHFDGYFINLFGDDGAIVGTVGTRVFFHAFRCPSEGIPDFPPEGSGSLGVVIGSFRFQLIGQPVDDISGHRLSLPGLDQGQQGFGVKRVLKGQDAFAVYPFQPRQIGVYQSFYIPGILRTEPENFLVKLKGMGFKGFFRSRGGRKSGKCG